LIIANDHADPRLVAADLLSQAEHDADALAIVVTTSLEVAMATQKEVLLQLENLPRKAIAEQSILRHGHAIVVEKMEDAVAFAEAYAPEHLELMIDDADAICAQIKNAGAIFVGASTPEAAGDYLAGPNHVLPTGGAARHGSPLGVYDFVKRTSILKYSPAALKAQAGDIVRLANVEGLQAHGRAVAARVGSNR
jgi:histidinol dehydrogenase